VSGRSSSTHLSLHVGSDWLVRCSVYPDTTPILSVDVAGTALNITPDGRAADESAVRFALQLVRNAQEFAAEVERIAQLPDKAAESTAA
jgi:hypothetical protein